jgi:hypothetical protein
MCFNAAKSWQLGWYEDKAVVVDPTVMSWSGSLMGVVDYENEGTDAVLLKIETGSETDYYVSFNRKSGFNGGTVEGGDQVLVTMQGEEGARPDPSTLVAKLDAGQMYQMGNLGTIIVNGINLSSTLAYADVTVIRACQSDADCWGGNDGCPASYCDGTTKTCERELIGNVFGCNCNGVCGDSESLRLYLNCGGPSYTDPAGNYWLSDDGYFNTGKPDSTTESISGTENDFMYQTDRWDDPFDPAPMMYSIPLESGNYDIVLHFSEIYFSRTGARRFDVLLEGSVVFSNVDIYAQAGNKNAAMNKTVTNFPVIDGALDVSFNSISNNPKVRQTRGSTMLETQELTPTQPPSKD